MAEINLNLTKDKVKTIFATAFYLGYMPIFPGAFGALPGVVIYYVLWTFLPPNFFLPCILLVTILLILLTRYLTPWATSFWHSKDPSQFVLDEIIGFLFVPIFYQSTNFIWTATVGFITFRVFDTIKIPPANYVDKNIEGWVGIVFDDVISAGYAALLLYVLDYFIEFLAIP